MMTRKHFFFRRPFLWSLGLSSWALLNLGCQSSARITGQVMDGFGKPLAGVKVAIAGTSLEAVSDSNGHYAVGYVPGSFEVQYGKAGYTSHTKALQLADKSVFPAETVKLYQIPENTGLYWLGASEYVRLGNGTLSVTSERPAVNFSDPNFEQKMLEGEMQTDSYHLSGNFVAVPANTEITLVQSQVKANVFLVRLLDDKTVFKRLYYAPSTLRDQANYVADQVEHVTGDLQLRRVTLPLGKYAFVTPSSPDIQPNLGKRRINEAFGRSHPLLQPIYLLQAGGATSKTALPAEAADTSNPTARTPHSYQFQGLIADKYPIQMTLQQDGAQLSGSYFYEKYRTPIPLKGQIDPQGNITVEEFAQPGRVTGTFRGKFDSLKKPNKFFGSWTKVGSKESLYFSLIERVKTTSHS